MRAQSQHGKSGIPFELPLRLFSVVAVTLFCSIAGILCGLLSEKLGQACHRAWGKSCCALIGIDLLTLHADRIPSDHSFIVAPNHASAWDILILASLPISFRWISKREVGWIPLMGWTMRALRFYFVQRSHSARDLNTMVQVEQGLKQGISVCIFPEGTRTRTGDLLPLKKGAFRTAQNSGAPLLPLAIVGSFDIAPKGKLPTSWRHRVALVFGEPKRIDKTQEIRKAMDDYHKTLIALLEEGASALKGKSMAEPTIEPISEKEMKSPMTLQLEFTPNPNTLKFVTNQEFLDKGAANFTTKEAATGQLLPEKLLNVTGVEAVLIGTNFVTVTKAPTGSWDQLAEEIPKTLEAHVASGDPHFSKAFLDERQTSKPSPGAESEIAIKIRDILDSEIRPAVAMDGGDITFDRYEDGVVYLHLQGSCSSCPSATATLRMGVETRLREAVPEIKGVVQV